MQVFNHLKVLFMSNIEKLNDIFCEVFSVDSSALLTVFDNKSVNGWDSVRQLSLIAAIEDSFNIMLDPEDIIGCTSYEAAKQILVKYDISI